MGTARKPAAPSLPWVWPSSPPLVSWPGDALLASIIVLIVVLGALGAVPPFQASGGPAAARPAAGDSGSLSPIVAVADVRKGVGAWAFNGVSQALADSGASWYYTWSPAHSGITTPPGVQFVPMIWGRTMAGPASLSQAQEDGTVLLGFNEPDNKSQSDMSVSEALSLWPRLMATGMTLGSPAVASGAATPGRWLDQFMKGADARGYRVNFIAVHWYGADFAAPAAVAQLRSYLQAIHDRYHLPIWLTEFALADWGSGTWPTDGQQATFLTAAATMLQGLAYVRRYAWFALPVDARYGNTGLFRSGPSATPAARAFEAAP